MPSHSIVQSNIHEGGPKLSGGEGLKSQAPRKILYQLSTPLHINKIKQSEWQRFGSNLRFKHYTHQLTVKNIQQNV